MAEAPERAGLRTAELERLAAYDIEPLLDAEDDEALYGDGDAAESFYARGVLGCIRVVPVLMQAALAGLADARPRVRAFAAMGAVTLAKTEPLRDHAEDVGSQLLGLARAARDTDERSAHVLALGDLGVSPTAFLEDPSPAVRMCAALAPGLAGDPAAIGVLLRTLGRHAGQIDDWFAEKPPQFTMRPRFRVVARLTEQVNDFDRLADAAVAVAGVTAKYCVDSDWGPLLAAAFPDGSGVVRSEAQRRFLGALVANAEFWDPRLGNAFKWFERAGLPYDREACAKRLKEW